MSKIEQLFEDAMKEEIFSGASMLMASSEKIFIQRNWGRTCTGGAPVQGDTRFDLASLTKPLITVTLTLRAISRHGMGLDDPLKLFFPRGVLPHDKKQITIRQLLNHCSGLPSYEPFYRKLITMPTTARPLALLSLILQTPLLASPGKSSHYSDLGFLLLGMILEQILGKPLDDLALHHILTPLDIKELHFCRLKTGRDAQFIPERLEKRPFSFAATEFCPWRNRLLVGEVHDENAYCLEGVAPHAGLFGTAHGIFRLLSFLQRVYRGSVRDSSWSSHILQHLWHRQDIVSGSTWALGFDTPSRGESSAGKFFSPQSIGHLGFTGTSFWMDLDQDVTVVLLTNRVHFGRQDTRIKAFRPLLHNHLMEAFYEFSRH